MHGNRAIPAYRYILYGQMDCIRPFGRPKKSWIDDAREDCVVMELLVSLHAADRLAKHRGRWRISVNNLGCQLTRGALDRGA